MAASRSVVTPERKAIALRYVNRRRLSWRHFWNWVKLLPVVVILFFVVRALLVEPFKIPTGSMEQTLLVDDFLLVNKLAYGAEVPFTRHRLPGLEQPKHDEIIVFLFPHDQTQHYIKRLVGLPGDTLAMRHGVLLRDGVQIAEPYVTHSDPNMDATDEDFQWQVAYLAPSTTDDVARHPSRNNWGPLIVPSKSYFVLGDNRDNSADSRYWGFVPDSLVGGRPMLVYYSYAPDAGTPFAWLTHIRWHRIGVRIK